MGKHCIACKTTCGLSATAEEVRCADCWRDETVRLREAERRLGMATCFQLDAKHRAIRLAGRWYVERDGNGGMWLSHDGRWIGILDAERSVALFSHSTADAAFAALAAVRPEPAAPGKE